VADGHHARADGFTSLAVALGAAGAAVGIERADPIIGLVIAVAILGVLHGAARQIYYRLMDAVDPAIVDHIETVAATTDGVRRVGSTKVRWLGHRLVADLAIVVAGEVAVSEGHTIAEEVRHRLVHGVAHLDEAHVRCVPVDIARPAASMT